MSELRGTFAEQYSAGLVGADAIDDFVDRWHAGEGNGSLADYLGFTEDEYAAWVENSDVLSTILDRHDRSRSVLPGPNA